MIITKNNVKLTVFEKPKKRCYYYFRYNNYQYYTSECNKQKLIEFICELSVCGCCNKRKNLENYCYCKKKEIASNLFNANIKILNNCKNDFFSLSSYLTKITFCKNYCMQSLENNNFEVCYNCNRSFFAKLMLEGILFKCHIGIKRYKHFHQKK